MPKGKLYRKFENEKKAQHKKFVEVDTQDYVSVVLFCMGREDDAEEFVELNPRFLEQDAFWRADVLQGIATFFQMAYEAALEESRK